MHHICSAGFIFLWQFFEIMYNGDEKLYIMKNGEGDKLSELL